MKYKQFGVLNNGGGHNQKRLCKMYKRTIAMISSLTMLFTTATFFPNNTFNLVGEITASAEGTEQQETDVASVIIDGVESYYTTLEEAFAAANGKTATITMLKDAECVSTSSDSQLMVSSGSVTLDMNGKILTGYGVGYSGIIDVSGGSLYVQGNGRVDVKVIGFSCHDGNLVIANTTFSAIGNGANYAMSAVYNNNGNITINSGSISGYHSDGQIYHYGGNTIINNIEMTEPSNKSCKGAYYYSTGKLEINGGTFGNITNRKGGVANLLGDGYTYKHQDGTWATDVELAGNSISNITIKKTPLKIEPQGDTAWYYNSGEHSLQINAAPLTDVKTISYEWYNGEIKLDCTADTYPIPKALTVGKYTYTCKATCDGYTLSHDFEFEVETCPHTGLDYKPLENNKHGGYCTICSNDVSEEHTWKDGVCSVCQTKAVAAMETGGVTTCYSTVEEAFTAAKGKTATITLLDNVTASSILYVNSGDNITFYGGNYTLTGTPGEMAINVSGGELTITGGTIKAVSGEYKRSDGSVYVDSGKLVVTGGTLQGADDVTNGIGLLVSGGTVDLSGGKFIGGTSGYCGGIYSSSLFLSKLLQNYSSITEPHYAYFDIDGRPIADVQNKKELAGTFIVAECKHDDSVYTYQPIDNTNTHHKTCRACGYSETAENCTYGNEYQHDNTNHWQTCEVCDGKNIEAHNIIAVNKKEPTCTENGNSEYWKCNDCGTCFSDENGSTEIEQSKTVISATGHKYSDGKCTVCGTFEDGIGAHLAGHSISLDGNIGVNFYMELDKSVIDDENAYMQFALPNGHIQAVNVSDATESEVDGKTYYVFSCNVAAKEMFDTIKAQIISGDKEGTVYEYSVKEYADYITSHSNDYDDDTINLVESMMNYGNSAKAYFSGQNVAEPEEEVKADKLTEFEKDERGTLPEGIEYYGSSLLLESETTVRHYFKVKKGTDVSRYDFKEKNGYYYTDISNIPAGQLATPQKTTIGEWSISYSPMSYVYSVLESDSTDENLKNLCQVLYYVSAGSRSISTDT